MTRLCFMAATEAPVVSAPDGSVVRVLCAGSHGSMASFTLPPAGVSRPVAHHSVEELWYVVSGSGRMWRKHETEEVMHTLAPGISLLIPVSTHFQFRCDGAEPLVAVAVTMPPWPGEREAYAVPGPWMPTV